MGRLQLNQQLKEEEVEAIVAFLRSLEGTVPEEALRLPILPTATLATPKPVFK